MNGENDRKPPALAGRKRPRAKTEATHPKSTDGSSTEDLQLLTPHTLRLLKLIEEGSSEHAQLAAVQLSDITAGSSPLVLWDVLGRLQIFLTSSQWSTRQNASFAMEGVARQLPVTDNVEFLENTSIMYREEAMDQHAWLTLPDVRDNMDTILKRGRTLLSSAETRFDQEEEDILDQLDENSKSNMDFVQRRIQLQRKILARRLGFSTVLSHVSGPEMESVISLEDLQPLAVELTGAKANEGHTKRQKLDELRSDCRSGEKSIRALLIMDIQHQQEESQRASLSYRVISHRNAQRLLATELIFRMFDASWYIRHGSLMGILALLKAWRVHNATFFGAWPQDILSRCLCVLALDRFADYSDTATSEVAGGIVAPVREMAGRIFSVLYQSAPESYRRACYDVLTLFARQRTKESDWELRYSALMTLTYIFTLQANTQPKTTLSGWPNFFFDSGLELGASGLTDESHDVRGVAAQLLRSVLRDGQNIATVQRSGLHAQIVKDLWKALSPGILISSSVKSLVGLLTALISSDFDFFLQNIDDSMHRSYASIFPKLKMLVACPYLSIRTSAVKLIGNVATHLQEHITDTSCDIDNRARRDIAVAFDDIIQTTFGFYFLCTSTLDNVRTNDEKRFDKARDNTWIQLTEAAEKIVNGFDGIRLKLEESIILRYFGFTSRSPVTVSVLTKASSGICQRIWLSVSEALATLLMRLAPPGKTSTHGVLKLSLRLCLESPFASHFERACFLLSSLFRRKAINTIILPEGYKIFLGEIIQWMPRCCHIDQTSIQKSGIALWESLKTVFQNGIQSLERHGRSTSKAISSISSVWNETIRSHTIRRSHMDINLDSMRISVIAISALIAGGVDCLPAKLTPIVRPIMTSIQNELDKDCRSYTCDQLVQLLKVLSTPASGERNESLQKTRLRILQQMCNMIRIKTEPGQSAASQTVAKLIATQDARIQSYGPIWEGLSSLTNAAASAESAVDGLHLLAAVSSGLHSNGNAASEVISTLLLPILSLYCCSEDPLVQELAATCTRFIITANRSLALEKALPKIASMCSEGEESVRERASELLLLTTDGPAAPLCPFVRSLLPLVMQLMTDQSAGTSKAATCLFSTLVQLAPLVQEDASSVLLNSNWAETADRVMDHLIRGKPLPPIEIHHTVQRALDESATNLRSYQLEGIAWLRFLQIVKLNGALTDSMGLGKTLQALVAVALAHFDVPIGGKSRSIVICPSSVLGHWEREVRRFFPGDTVFRPFCLHGHGCKNDERADWNLIITSYATLRTEIGYLSKIMWKYCVLDEGHLLKNPKTATAKAARQLQAQHKLILTGTPVQNKVHEVWATFDFLMPNFLGSSSQFSREFAKPITKGQTPGASAADIALGMEKLKMLHQQVLPFILRREKEQVLKELPPKIITQIPCEMSELQSRLHDDFCSSAQCKSSLRRLYTVLKDQQINGEALPSVGSDVLKVLLYLRLVCTHPTLVDTKGISAEMMGKVECSGKLLALRELLTQVGMPGKEISAADSDASLLYIDDEREGQDAEDEFKEALDPDAVDAASSTLLPLDRVQGGKCLIFAQFTRSLDVVESFLNGNFPATKYLRLDGKVPSEKRGDMVDMFNNDRDTKILLLTTRIGGLGLNLTGADVVIFLEHDWNPHVDLQAMDRAHRIGQQRTVNVYKLVTKDSIEEKIMRLHETKLAMSDAIVNAENSSLYSMGTDQLLDIFRFRGEGSSFQGKDVESTLDILVERYEDEYRSLSLDEFVAGLKGLSEEKRS